jgi:hypothetical protein
VVVLRQCTAITDHGTACAAAPMRGGDYCFFHDPTHQDEATEARRLGGLRRRRESVVTGTFELEPLNSVAGIRRLLEIAVTDTLSLENSIARSRALAHLAHTAARLLETGELEARLGEVEAAVYPRRVPR